MTREEAISAIKSRCSYCEFFPICVNDKPECFCATEMAITALSLPSAQRKGKWIEMGTNTDGTHNIKCSKCGEGYKTRGHAKSIATRTKYNFCPNCGADMRGEDDETHGKK